MGAVGIIRKNEKVLLERRTDSERWAFIGGGLKMEESLEECVQREIREETGLVVEDLKLLDVFSYPTELPRTLMETLCVSSQRYMRFS